LCKAFSLLVTKDHKTVWKSGVDSHDELIKIFKLNPENKWKDDDLFARVEIVPDNQNKYPYLYPDLPWKLNVDEQIRPEWFDLNHHKVAWDTLLEWKQIIYRFNYAEALNPVNPLTRKVKPTKKDIELLKEWASVWDSVRASVWASVGASVRASVGDSVGAYMGSLFPNIEDWKYIKHEPGKYPYQSCVDLWTRGLVPSFDGTTWRLHSGKKAEIVHEMKKKEDEQPMK